MANTVSREILFRAGDPFCSPLFADGHPSIVFTFPRVCRADGIWQRITAVPQGVVIGPMTRVGSTSLAERPEMVGAYLRVSGTTRLTRVAATELTDRIVALEDLWGPSARALATNLSEMNQDCSRVACLESALLQTIAHSRTLRANFDISGLTAMIFQHRGQLSVQCLADAVGISRQHLTRVFHQTVGISPKVYCRLARFQAVLPYARHGDKTPWAQVAAEAGYADQSHLIAEFRHFSSLTPEMLAAGRWFHPFIERACHSHDTRSRHQPSI
jgi:AraC-like DNA-binding protein